MMLSALYGSIQDNKDASTIEGSMASLDLLTPDRIPSLNRR